MALLPHNAPLLNTLPHFMSTGLFSIYYQVIHSPPIVAYRVGHPNILWSGKSIEASLLIYSCELEDGCK